MAHGATRLLFLAAVVTLQTTPITAAVEYLVTAPGYLTPNTNVKVAALVKNPSSAGQLTVELWATRSGINENSTVVATQSYPVSANGKIQL